MGNSWRLNFLNPVGWAYGHVGRRQGYDWRSMPGHVEEDESPRRDVALAVAALFLLLTAFWMPWWAITVEQDGETLDARGIGVFRDPGAVGHHVRTIGTGVLAAVAAGALFVRVAARSWVHEPSSWRRDLALAALITGVALVSATMWPTDVPRFWHAYTVEGGQQVRALPGLGWWLALAATLCATGAALVARSHSDK